MNRGKKFYLILGTIVLNAVTFALSTTFITLSWFNKGFDIEFNKQTGTSEANYFASGDGTKGNPYKITTPRHYYNFAWLQYLGEFNKIIKKDNIDAIDQKYFALANDIDMNEYVVPPVGTSEYAFVGNFNGGGNVINNLKVSNNFADFGVRHPSIVSEANFNEKNINILGTFGVVGNDEVNRTDTDRTKYYHDEHAVNTPINCIQNLYLDNVTITSTSNELLIGIIAGYADGVIKTCGVHYATFNINGETLHISNGVTDKISNYTLLGAYNTKRFYWDGKPGFDGTNVSWGDSISMLTLYRRIAYMAASSNKGYYGYKTKIDGYPLTVSFGNSNGDIPYYNSSFEKIPYLNIYKDSYLPLSIDTNEAFNEEITVGVNKTTAFYKSGNAKETILKSNSGYVIGGTGNYPSVSMRLEPHNVGLANSYVDNNVGETYNKNKIRFSTIDTTSSSTVEKVIDDNEAKNFIKFKEVKDKFDLSMLGMRNINGFHFYNELKQDKRTVVNDGSVKINGDTYSSYEFLDSSLNFTVKDAGYITTINGSYYFEDKNKKQTLFDLYYVNRNYSNTEPKISTISQIRKIVEIYKDSSNGIKYVFDNNEELTSSNFDSNSQYLAFDFEKVSNTARMTPFKAYYYEIPVMPGDYAIGKDKNTADNNAYVMYLDIGANLQKEDESGEALEYIDFVSKEGNKIQKMDANYKSSKIGFYIDDTKATMSFNFRRLGNIVYYFALNKDYSIIQKSTTITVGFEISKADDSNCDTPDTTM